MNSAVAAAMKLRQRSLRRLALVLTSVLVAGCAAGLDRPAAVTYTGELEVFLEPFDEKGSCSVTIALRNLSKVRQGDANLKLAWFDASGALIAEPSLQMDGLLDGRVDAKNLALPVRCRQVERLAVRSAKWVLFEGWDAPKRTIVRIDGVEGGEWQMGWNAEMGLFVGSRLVD